MIRLTIYVLLGKEDFRIAFPVIIVKLCGSLQIISSANLTVRRLNGKIDS